MFNHQNMLTSKSQSSLERGPADKCTCTTGEEGYPDHPHHQHHHHHHQDPMAAPVDSRVNFTPFVGRLGGLGYVPPDDQESQKELLEAVPDAAPLMTFSQVLDLRPFRSVDLWKSALMEGMGTFYSTSTAVCLPFVG